MERLKTKIKSVIMRREECEFEQRRRKGAKDQETERQTIQSIFMKQKRASGNVKQKVNEKSERKK